MTERTLKSGRERIRHRLLTLLPKASVGAEIGVSKGDYSEEMVRTVEPAELVLIDPWDLLAAQGGATSEDKKWFQQQDKMKGFHDGVVERFAGNDRVKIKRGFSQDILPDYDDGYFDWVYIDASHLYQDVRDEVVLCIRKVKEGGLIMGDDLYKEADGRKQVWEAVQDVLETCGLPGELGKIDADALPETVVAPSRLAQQYIIPVTADLKANLAKSL